MLKILLNRFPTVLSSVVGSGSAGVGSDVPETPTSSSAVVCDLGGGLQVGPMTHFFSVHSRLTKYFTYVPKLCESKQRKNMLLTISWVLKGCEEIIACTNGGNVIKIIRSVSDVVKIRGQAAANGQQQPVANNRSGH